jgi:hypothetical protein
MSDQHTTMNKTMTNETVDAAIGVNKGHDPQQTSCVASLHVHGELVMWLLVDCCVFVADTTTSASIRCNVEWPQTMTNKPYVICTCLCL